MWIAWLCCACASSLLSPYKMSMLAAGSFATAGAEKLLDVGVNRPFKVVCV